MTITVDTVTPGDDLNRVSWSFYVSDSWHGRTGITMVLDGYTALNRATKRHSFKPVKGWRRLSGRHHSSAYEQLRHPPVVPLDIYRRARQQVADTIDLANEDGTVYQPPTPVITT